MTIKTYPEMNKKIKDILRIGGTHSGLYAAQRIEELEDALKKIVDHSGINKEIDLELWRNAKKALEG